MSKIEKILSILIVFLFLATIPLSAQTVVPTTPAQIDKLIGVIKSNAPYKEKADACRLLGLVGDKKAIAPLAALLGDEKLSHMARYGLEPIPHPAVDDALRNALGKIKGAPLVGVIGSIGVRRDTQAVPALVKFLKNSDPDVAQAAARALGSIGNPMATKQLQQALPGISDANRLAFCEGLLRCAENLAGGENRALAIGVYDQLRKLSKPHQVRAAGVRGAILTRQKEGIPLLHEYLRSDDYILFSAAVQAAQELPGPDVTQALAAALKQLSNDHQILVMQTLGLRGDIAALPALFALVSQGAKPVRLVAIRTLSDIGHDLAAAGLVGLLKDGDREIAAAARESLAAIPGKTVDEIVMAMLKGKKDEDHLIALELIGRRRMVSAVPTLINVAGTATPEVRRAAIKKVGELGGPLVLPVLLELTLKMQETADLNAGEQAMKNILAQVENTGSFAGMYIRSLAQAQPAQKVVILRVLSNVGGTDALKAVHGAVDDANRQVHGAAIRALCSWKDVAAGEMLLGLAKTAQDESDKTLCLRGYLGLVAKAKLRDNRKLAMCREAQGLIRRADEKKMLLGVLSGLSSPGAMDVIVPYLDEAGTREEASAACVTVAERILKRGDAAKHAAKLAAILKKVLQVTENKDLARKARGLLKQAQSKAGN